MAQKRDRKKNLGKEVRKKYRAQKRNSAISAFFVLLTCVAVVAMVWLEIIPDKYSVSVGEISQERIVATGEATDPEKTRLSRQEAMDAVADIYAIDRDKSGQIKDAFTSNVFSTLFEVAQRGELIRPGSVDGYVDQYNPTDIGFGKEKLSFIKDSKYMTKEDKVISVLNSSKEDIENLQAWFNKELDTVLNRGIKESVLTDARKELAQKVRDTSATQNGDLRTILADAIEDSETLLIANSFFDEASTNAAKEKAAVEVQPVKINRDEVIVDVGETITEDDIAILTELHLLEESGFAYPFVVGSVGLVIVLLFVAACYIWVFDKKMVTQPKKVFLLCILILVNIIIALLLKSATWEKMMNAAIGTILIAMLFDEHLALVINTVMSVILVLFISDESGVFTIDAMPIMISSLTGGMAAIYTCKSVKVSSNRTKMLIPGFVSGLVAMVTSFAVMWIAGSGITTCVTTALYGLAGGVIAALFSAASLSFWESMFGLLTQSKLLELSNSSSDLLRKISIEIPGTYQHSTTVAEMAENGAKDIGANPMLAKVGALYHDIGKLRCPECYTENQTAESKNFHNALTPMESAKMIFSHITEGVQIAKANKLPREIIDIIKEHHGTSSVMYFYNKARELDRNVKLEDFCYPGPSPQTKVAGIIMLADCIEASVRSLDEKTHDSIKAQIEKMFKARMDAGELDNCELTLKDINVLKNSFLNTLTAVYHTRIKYDNGQEKKK